MAKRRKARKELGVLEDAKMCAYFSSTYMLNFRKSHELISLMG